MGELTPEEIEILDKMTEQLRAIERDHWDILTGRVVSLIADMRQDITMIKRYMTGG